MAISKQAVPEVQKGVGAATNGGFFVPGGGGTDYSQQAGPILALTDAVANGTTTLTSATGGFTSALVNNGVYLAGGSGSLAATARQVISVTDSNTLVVDATVAAGTGITLNVGGCWDDIPTLAARMVTSNKAFVKATATYTTTTGFTFAQSLANASNVSNPTRVIGYGTVRGDGGRPTLQLSGGTNPVLLTLSGGGWDWMNFVLDCNNVVGSTLYSLPSVPFNFYNCKFMNWKNAPGGIALGSLFLGCEWTGGSGTYSLSTGGWVIACSIHDLTCTGLQVGQGGVALLNEVWNCTGASSDGIRYGGGAAVILNTVDGVGRDCLHKIDNFDIGQVVLGNLIAEPGAAGYCHNGGTAAGLSASPRWDGNAMWQNAGLGLRNFLDDAGTVNAANGVAPWANALDVTLSGDPFVNKAVQNFLLNAAAGAGASARAVAPPRGWPGLSMANARDFGAAQHADSGGGGGPRIGSGLIRGD